MIRCKLQNNCKNTDVFAIISQFFESNDIWANFAQLNYEEDSKFELFSNEIKNNIYISNRSLSDEIKYVLNR